MERVRERSKGEESGKVAGKFCAQQGEREG